MKYIEPLTRFNVSLTTAQGINTYFCLHTEKPERNMRYGLTLVLSMILLGCAQISLQPDKGVYFGGEIINPKEGLVILYNEQGKVEDSLQLDANNRFFVRLDSVNTGLYSFRHGGEYQMVILEPHDSIMLRLNTYDFDESLVFSGKGAESVEERGSKII